VLEATAHPAGDGMVLDDAGRSSGGGGAVVVVDGSLAHSAGAAAGERNPAGGLTLRKLLCCRQK